MDTETLGEPHPTHAEAHPENDEGVLRMGWAKLMGSQPENFPLGFTLLGLMVSVVEHGLNYVYILVSQPRLQHRENVRVHGLLAQKKCLEMATGITRRLFQGQSSKRTSGVNRVLSHDFQPQSMLIDVFFIITYAHQMIRSKTPVFSTLMMDNLWEPPISEKEC